MENKRHKNLEFWLSQPNGFIKDNKTLTAIRKNSESLNTLYRKGIDITSIYKFSPEEERVSEVIGKLFLRNSYVIQDLKREIALNNPMGKIKIRSYLFHQTKQLLRELVKLNVIANDFAYEITWDKKGKRSYELIEEKDLLKIVRAKKKVSIKIHFSFTYDNSKRTFIVGHWFNAYASKIIYQHLKRNDYDFEIYTRVEYQSPLGASVKNGDFDILVLVNDKVLMIECKFSKLNERNKRSINSVIQKSDQFKNVLGVTSQKFDYIPILVYDKKNVKDANFLSKTFKNSDFHLIDIQDLRSTIVNVFMGQAVKKNTSNQASQKQGKDQKPKRDTTKQQPRKRVNNQKSKKHMDNKVSKKEVNGQQKPTKQAKTTQSLVKLPKKKTFWQRLISLFF